ncbi:hypothetical protein D8911_12920 [Levilactobacillus brevis]|nr:hypothetical protein D8911_12920 [Levilactobacillus brevis]
MLRGVSDSEGAGDLGQSGNGGGFRRKYLAKMGQQWSSREMPVCRDNKRIASGQIHGKMKHSRLVPRPVVDPTSDLAVPLMFG